MYKTLSDFLKEHFDGKIQKLSINAGFTCPNRDGTVGWGGCTYCNNQSFNPEYCETSESVTEQLERGKEFFARKYPSMRYLAYFQAYTSTYGEVEHLISLYEEALKVKDIVGLVIGTRPDCMPPTLLSYLSELAKRTFVMVEYGVESCLDRTLLRINRGHDFSCAAEAIRKTHDAGIYVGVHLILGLPGESHEDIMSQAELLNNLPLDTLKLHQLQIIKGTKMAKEYAEHPEDFSLYKTSEEYADLVCDFIIRLRPDITLERFTSSSPKSLLIAPDWGMKNYEFVELVKKRLALLGR